MMKTPWLVAALLVLPLPARAADPIDALGRFVGTWTSTGEFVKTAYSKASNVSGTTVCSWSIGHDFVICQQTVIANANEQHDLAIYTYDGDSKSYRFYNVGTGRVGSTTITVEPMQITYPGTFTEGDQYGDDADAEPLGRRRPLSLLGRLLDRRREDVDDDADGGRAPHETVSTLGAPEKN